MRGPNPFLAAAALVTMLLAGCVGDDGTDTPSEPPALTGADLVAAQDNGTTDLVGPDDGWLAFDGTMTTETFTLEGSFGGHEAFTPAHPFINGAGLGGNLPPSFHIHDITDQIPTDIPVWVSTELTYDTDNGGTWVNGPSPAFWIYDSDGSGNGMSVRTLIVRGAADPIGIGVWHGSPDPAPEVTYQVEVSVHYMPEWFPSAITYGFEVGSDEVLELRFGGSADPETVWVWDDDDVFLGPLSPYGDDRDLLRIAPGDDAVNAASGELVVFVTEGAPPFRARVIGPEGVVSADFRILQQVIAAQGPWTATGGQATEFTFDVPVQSLQVGYSIQAPSYAVDASIAFAGPQGNTIDSQDFDGPSAGFGSFFNTDMGTPRMPTGTYSIAYSDTQSQDVQVDGWYVTYGR